MDQDSDVRESSATTTPPDDPSTPTDPNSPEEAPGVRDATALVPDTLEGESEETPSPQPNGLLTPALANLRERLARQNLTTRTVHIGVSPYDEVVLKVDLPAGTGTRPVLLRTAAAEAAMDADFSELRLGERYDAVWTPSLRSIEAAVRTGRFGAPVGSILARFAGEQTPFGTNAPWSTVTLTSPSGAITVRLGPASALGDLILGTSRFAGRTATLALSGLQAASMVEAESALEEIADALTFETEINFGASLALVRLEPQTGRFIPRRHRGRGTLRFPVSRYPHEPVMLFRAGRDRTSAPTIRYWAFYQVLEYFFPKYSLEDARKRAARLLRDPTFDVHGDDDITRLVQQLRSTSRGAYGREEDQLQATIEAVVDEDEVREFIASSEPVVSQHLSDRRSEISNEVVSLNAPDDIRKAVTRRVYDVRCRIVHSKSGSEREVGAGLIPGSHHDDLMRVELPLIEFLAERALVASGEPLVS